MGEMRVPCEGVDADPLDRTLLVPCSAQLPNLSPVGAVGAPDGKMAAHARLHRWNPRLSGSTHRVMTILTLNAELSRVNVVPEEDRLAGAFEARRVGHSQLGRGQGVAAQGLAGDRGFGLLGGGVAENREDHDQGRHSRRHSCDQLSHASASALWRSTTRAPHPPAQPGARVGEYVKAFTRPGVRY